MADQKIGNAANGTKSTLDGTEKLPITGTQNALVSGIKDYAKTIFDTLYSAFNHSHADSDNGGIVNHTVLTNAGTGLHVPTYSSDSTTFLNGMGEWTTPPGTGGITYSSDSTEYLNGKGEFTIPAGGSATLLKAYWSPDAPPASPSGTDSEFSGGSGGVPSGFTEYDPGTLLTVTESSTYKNVQLLASTTAVTLDVLGIYKAIPAGDFTIWTKVKFLGPAANYSFTGLCLWEDATDSSKKIAGYGLSPRGATLMDNGIYTWTNWNTFSAATESNFQFVAPCVYVRLRRTGTTYMMAFSNDGEAFLEYSTAVNPGFTPTHFGVGIGNTTGADALATFDFFRYVASDVGVTGILAGQAAGIYQ
jgi:hypothetical protein